MLKWPEAREWDYLNVPRVASFPGRIPVWGAWSGPVLGFVTMLVSSKRAFPGKTGQLNPNFGCYSGQGLSSCRRKEVDSGAEVVKIVTRRTLFRD